MSDDGVAILLYDLRTKQAVEARLHYKIKEQHIIDTEKLWVPMLHGSTQEDAHWDWRKKASWYNTIGGSFGIDAFVIECENETQGIMYTETKRKCLLPEQNSEFLVYIHFIAAAPWNRKTFMDELQQQRKFSGVGTILMNAAIDHSNNNNLQGRIGLHSLPQAEEFYRDCKMTELHYDPKKRMRYFEMTPQQSQHYVNRA